VAPGACQRMLRPYGCRYRTNLPLKATPSSLARGVQVTCTPCYPAAHFTSGAESALGPVDGRAPRSTHPPWPRSPAGRSYSDRFRTASLSGKATTCDSDSVLVGRTSRTGGTRHPAATIHPPPSAFTRFRWQVTCRHCCRPALRPRFSALVLSHTICLISRSRLRPRTRLLTSRFTSFRRSPRPIAGPLPLPSPPRLRHQQRPPPRCPAARFNAWCELRLPEANGAAGGPLLPCQAFAPEGRAG